MLVFDQVSNPQKGKPDHGSIREGGMYLAMLAMKDMKWNTALAGDDATSVISSFHGERESLLSTVLTLVEKDDPDHEYDELHRMAVTGRYLLDLRRNEARKTRGVKQGFKENKITADGDGLNYYSHVVKLYTVRMCFFRVGRGSCRVAILDQRTAFLQSDKLPPDIVKSLLMFNPITLEWELFRQSGPLYGENSAPRRWEDTYSLYLKSEGFVCGFNDRSIFWHPERDVNVVDLTYVDDNCLDGEEAEIAWATDMINERFDCKDLDWVPMDGVHIDYFNGHAHVYGL